MSEINEKIERLSVQQDKTNSLFKPLFYRLINAIDLEAFNRLLDQPSLIVNDNLLGQLKELMKIQNPTQKLHEDELEALAFAHFSPLPIEQYGVWVFYPWSNRLVHILDAKEFIEVRTSRNMYKITPEEREILSHKKIGVIGLSVGQSVSLTMAMERIGGELRLADFDTLELTNLNRIRTGVHNLGLPKVYAVAREIAEIDPFLIVRCYPNGLKEENMDDFFTEGGKLDLLVEESDGFDIKILSRYKAKALGIPVIMEASDRCMVDVERFDLEPERSILHGLVDHLDINTLKSLKTTEDKIPYMLDILGLETSSPRLKASMLEIDQTINTWPQLASAVTMGGGITADVSRRILLNSFTESGRYHVDIEELIGNTKIASTTKEKTNHLEEGITLDEIKLLLNKITSPPLSEITNIALEEVIKAALIAPSAGNNQPWKWVSKNNVLYLFHEKEKYASWADHKSLISNISLGASIENVVLKSKELGYEAFCELKALSDEERLVAIIHFTTSTDQHSNNDNDLSKYINIRHTNRKRGRNQSPFDTALTPLLEKSIQTIKGARFSVTSDSRDIDKIANIVATSEKIRFLHPQAHHDFFAKEIKWQKDTKKNIEEGLDVKTLELTLSQEVGLSVASEPLVVELLNQWNKGDAFKKISLDTVKQSSAIGIITMPEFDDINWINGGRAVQRLWLMTSKLNIALQPISAPLFLYAQLKFGGEENIPQKNRHELTQLHNQLKSIFPDLNHHEGLFLFRLSDADLPSIRSLRRPLNEMYFKIQ